MGLFKKFLENLTGSQSDSDAHKLPSIVETIAYRKKAEDWLESYYDLNTAEGIQAIPEIKHPPKCPDCDLYDVTSDIDYYLQFKSVEHEKAGNIEMAILCLRKSNAIRMVRLIGYRKSDYYRLVRILAQNGYVKEAYAEKAKIDAFFGEYHLDGVREIIVALKKAGEYKSAEDLRLASIQKAQEDRDYLEGMIPFEIQRGQDMRDFQWIQDNLQDICPKSLTGYRRMKKQNTKNYRKIVEAARAMGHELNYHRLKPVDFKATESRAQAESQIAMTKSRVQAESQFP